MLIKWMVLIAAAYFLATSFARFRYRSARIRQASPVDYVYKIARITGNSEYDVFCKAAENWPVSQEMISRDFDIYINRNVTPYYVNDFIRKNRHHVDELRMPFS